MSVIHLQPRPGALLPLGVYRYGDEIVCIIAHRGSCLEVLDHRGEFHLVPPLQGVRRVHGELAAALLLAAEMHRGAFIQHQVATDRATKKAWFATKWSSLQLYARLVALLEDTTQQETKR